MKKRVLLALNLALMSGAATAVYAQTADVETVVVTAERRAEALKDVPLSVWTASGKDLANIGADTVKGLTMLTPGLEFSTKAVFAQPFIRGIGSTVIAPGADNNIALYIDGVYQPNQNGNLTGFNNVDRIEVLKGPQGTLFGRNATGGAIKVVTRDPSFDQSFEGGLDYGSYNELKLTGYMNIPVSDEVAFNVATMYHRDDGYFHNIATGNRIGQSNFGGARAKLLFEPTNDLRIIVAANYFRTTDASFYANQPINGNNSSVPLGAVFPTDPYKVALSYEPRINSEIYDTNIRGEYDLGNGVLSSLTSYANVQAVQQFEQDGGPLPITHQRQQLPSRTFSQEFNYASGYDGPFNWVGGLYMYQDNAPMNEQTFNDATSLRTAYLIGHVLTQAWALYAQGDYEIVPELRLTVGGRYGIEKKHAVGGPAGTTTVDAQKTWNSFTPRVALRYTLDEASNVYASFSKGFKSGVFNLIGLSNNPVDPEKIAAYEVGYKYGSNRISLNLAGFYYNYDDIQVTLLTSNGSTLSSVLQNAASARVRGFDADGSYAIDDHWTIQAGTSYLDAVYVNYPDALVTVPKFTGGLPAGNSQVPVDASGTPMIQAPKWTFNIHPTFRHELFGGAFEATAVLFYHGSMYWYPGNARLKEDPYTQLNATVSWSPESGRYRASLWGRNITDARYSAWTTTSAVADARTYAAPATFGVSLDVNLP